MSKLKFFQKCLNWSNSWGGLPCIYWIKAAEAYSREKFNDAIELYEKGLEKYSNHPARFSAQMDLAYAYFKTGNVEKSVENLKSILRQIPDSKEAYIRLAYIYCWNGADSEAMWLLRNANKKFPDDMRIFYLFLLALSESKAPQYLLEEIQAIETLKSSDSLSACNNALVKYLTGFHKEGRNLLTAAACNENALLGVKIVLAKILIHEGKECLARLHLNHALKISPEYPRTLSLLAKTYFMEYQQNQSDESLNFALQLAIKAAQNSFWNSPRELHILAEIYHAFGDKASALLMASKAQDLYSRRSDIYLHDSSLDEFVTSLASGTLS